MHERGYSVTSSRYAPIKLTFEIDGTSISQPPTYNASYGIWLVVVKDSAVVKQSGFDLETDDLLVFLNELSVQYPQHVVMAGNLASQAWTPAFATAMARTLGLNGPACTQCGCELLGCAFLPFFSKVWHVRWVGIGLVGGLKLDEFIPHFNLGAALSDTNEGGRLTFLTPT